MIGAGALVAGAALVALIRASRRIDAIFPDVARSLGLERSTAREGSVFSAIVERERLWGTIDGRALEVESFRRRSGQLRERHTRVVLGGLSGLARFAVHVTRARAPQAHAVLTDDATFDRARGLASDAPGLVRAALGTEVRAKLLACDVDALNLRVDGDHVVASFADTPASKEQLERVIDVVRALADAAPREGAPRASPELADAREADEAHGAHVDALARTFGFSLAALAANRQGRIHPEQLAWARGAGRAGARTLFVLAALALVGGLGGAALFYQDLGPSPSRVDVNATLAIAGAGVLVALGFAAWGRALARRAALRLERFVQGVAERAEGPIEKRHVRGGRNAPDSYAFRVGDRWFGVRRSHFDALTEGVRHRVYFAGEQLLSIEPAPREKSDVSAPRR